MAGPLTVTELKQYARLAPQCRAFIETGTYYGESLAVALASDLFDEVHSIDISARYVERAALANPSAYCHCGDSGVVLRKLLPMIRQPAFFFLDAHWWSATVDCPQHSMPLFEELAAIAPRGYADLIVVDDVACFGRGRADVGENWRAVNLDTIKTALGRVSQLHVSNDRLILLREPAA